MVAIQTNPLFKWRLLTLLNISTVKNVAYFKSYKTEVISKWEFWIKALKPLKTKIRTININLSISCNFILFFKIRPKNNCWTLKELFPFNRSYYERQTYMDKQILHTEPVRSWALVSNKWFLKNGQEVPDSSCNIYTFSTPWIETKITL